MFYIVQAGAKLQVLASGGALVQDVTLPSGVTVDPTRHAQIAVLNRQVVVANAVSENIWIDPATFDAFRLAIAAPSAAPVASQGSAGALVGAYSYAYTFIHKISGIVVNESPLSAVSNTVTLAANKKLAGTIGVLPAGDWTGRRIYRTAQGGSDLFEDIDIDDVVSTTFETNTPDLELSLLPFDTTRIVAPGGSDGTSRLMLLIEWKNYLWAVPSQAALVDSVYRSDINAPWSWSSEAVYPASPAGEDAAGVVAFIKRRDAIGIGKRSRVLKIIGSSDEDFQIIGVVEKIGVEATESVVVDRDKGYWLSAGSVLRWDDSGVLDISSETVQPWFRKTRTTESVFDRSRFSEAIGAYNSDTDCYELGLIPTDGSALTRWISFSIQDGKWLGPHLTDAFTPTSRMLLRSDDAVLMPAIGGDDGFIYLQNQTGAQDVPGNGDDPTSISFAVTSKLLTNGDPQSLKVWGRMALLSRIETSGVELSVTNTVGKRGRATAQGARTYDLTLGEQMLKRPIGSGATLSVRFTQNHAGWQCLIFGILITPVTDMGRQS